jgi:hypothetical protein
MSDLAYTCHFLDRDAFRVVDDARMALAKKREADPEWLKADNATYGWASLSEVTAPCPMWFSYWFFDPDNPGHAARRAFALNAIQGGTFSKENYHLSKMYWQQWSDKRPPICVLCPNGREWCVDAVSSNGDGWTVTGEPPKITCAPSILVPGYHGYLRDGVFTLNM